MRTTLTYKVHPTLSVGIEYNPRAGKFSPLANWLAIKETRRRPALILGTSSGRIGTPTGQSFYGTVSKSLQREIKLPIAPYVGLSYERFDDRFRLIGGTNIRFTDKLSSLVVFDGVHVHPMLNFTHGQHTFTFIMVKGRNVGVGYSLTF